MNIVWSPRAQIHLTEYARQLAEYDCPETARSWLLAVQAKSATLADFPRAGRVSPEFRMWNISMNIEMLVYLKNFTSKRNP